MRMKFLIAGLLLLIFTVGCAGVRMSSDNSVFVAHGESFHLLGLKIPGDALDLAKAHVPPGAKNLAVTAPPADWTSLSGLLNNLFGLHVATISGETK